MERKLQTKRQQKLFSIWEHTIRQVHDNSWSVIRSKSRSCRQVFQFSVMDGRGLCSQLAELSTGVATQTYNSLRIYRRFKKEMKEEDYSGSLESMVWLRARTNSLNLGENSWQRNRDVCVGCSEERETLRTHSPSNCTALGGKSGE